MNSPIFLLFPSIFYLEPFTGLESQRLYLNIRRVTYLLVFFNKIKIIHQLTLFTQAMYC